MEGTEDVIVSGPVRIVFECGGRTFAHLSHFFFCQTFEKLSYRMTTTSFVPNIKEFFILFFNS